MVWRNFGCCLGLLFLLEIALAWEPPGMRKAVCSFMATKNRTQPGRFRFRTRDIHFWQKPGCKTWMFGHISPLDGRCWGQRYGISINKCAYPVRNCGRYGDIYIGDGTPSRPQGDLGYIMIGKYIRKRPWGPFYSLDLPDTDFQLSGPDCIIGRTMVLHEGPWATNNGGRLACCTIKLTQG